MNNHILRRLLLTAISLVLLFSALGIAACGNTEKPAAVSVPDQSSPVKSTVPQSPSANAAPAGYAEVPSQYTTVYATLKNTLDKFDVYLDSQGGPRNATVFAAELLTANCNRGEDLLKPNVMAAVRFHLDRLQQLGVQGVTIPIHYPLYTPQFPRHSEYVSFYKEVTQEVHRRGMTLDIESHVLFANTPFSPVKWDYSGLTFDQYKALRREMISRLVNDLHPDILNIGAEPDTEASLMGMKDLLDPQKYTDYIAYLLDGLQRGNTKVVAGVGSWGNLEYARKLALQPSLDGLSLHVYPVIGECLNKAVKIADLARANNKFVVFDECWLSKTDVLAANSVASSPENFKRDAYSFWAPLDEQFLSVMVKFSRYYGVIYLSPFWSNFFYGYLDFTPDMMGWSFPQTAAALAPVQSRNALDGKFTTTAEKYKALIAQNR